MSYTRGDGKPDSQPRPTPGAESVVPWLLQEMPDLDPRIVFMLGERTTLGIQRYGTPLMSWNGRDALQDVLEEEVDGLQYMAQCRMEATSEYFLVWDDLIDHKIYTLTTLLSIRKARDGN